MAMLGGFQCNSLSLQQLHHRYENINEQMEEHYPEILRRYLGEERDGGSEYFDQTTKVAADICGASQRASDAAQTTEPVGRKERSEFSGQVRPLEEDALKVWAIQNNLWIPENEFLLR